MQYRSPLQTPLSSYSDVNFVDFNLDDSQVPEHAHFAGDLESDSIAPDVTPYEALQCMMLTNSDPITVPSQVEDQQCSSLQTTLQVSPCGVAQFGSYSPCSQHSDYCSSCSEYSPASILAHATESMESCSGSGEKERATAAATKKSGKRPVKMPQSK